MCDMHVVCESGNNIHTFLHSSEMFSVCAKIQWKVYLKKKMLYFINIFFNFVRILEPQNFKLDFSDD